MSKVLVIGAGHAGGSAAAFLRQYGHQGEIVLVGDEATPPYQRPPLSKGWLVGSMDVDDILLRPEAFYVAQGVDLRLGVTATSIDRQAKAVRFSDGAIEGYDRLILATGSTPRRLQIPVHSDSRLLELRSLPDATRLKAALGPGKRLAIIGGGYVGLEAAASARRLGAEVVVLERMERILARVASDTLSTFYADRHRVEGVDIRTGVEAASISPGRVTLTNGDAVSADAVLVGIGATACDDLALAAGLECRDGVLVDLEARTSDPDIYAIGDMTRRPMPLYDCSHRLESVGNALEQARQAAAAITGRAAPPAEVPWFWSDQFDVKLQIAGLPFGADGEVVRGDPRRAGFSVFHLKGERIVCVEAVTSAPAFMFGKQMIARGASVDAVRLADSEMPLKAALRD
ncbi:MAG: FAD-dependent oxidoreductase [Candidatus Brevundimonas phytovorans]|nr:FAD-dependent oxidoreductase [Brevundimonas sp.]WEK56784.1 MAG: FAD-dependent oxidoreductase [Brevundimonas sp.]